MFLAPLPTFYGVYKKKTTEDQHQSLAYVIALLSAMVLGRRGIKVAHRHELFILLLFSFSSPMVVADTHNPGGASWKLPMGLGEDGLPGWVKARDWNLLLDKLQVDVVVSADGTGDYRRIMDAVEAAPNNSDRKYVIHVKKGLYLENVRVNSSKVNLMLIGDGMDITIISGNRSNDGIHWDTFNTATFAVSGNGFIARDLTFENTAGPQMNQSLALLSQSNHSVFFRCGIRGYQDTLCAHAQHQFYRECRITGTVDFIFGEGVAVFQNCEILAKKGSPEQNTVTAHGRKKPNDPTGFSFQFCNISADSDLIASGYSNPTYLGRPWQRYSRTIFMESYISSIIKPEGWLEWEGHKDFDNTVFYAEYKNYGPGANLNGRVKWPGFHAINDYTQADIFTVAKFIDGDSWLPSTGISYTSGLTA